MVSCRFKPGELDEELFWPETMKIDGDLLIVPLSFDTANSTNAKFDMADLQANSQALIGVRDDTDFIVIDEWLSLWELRVDLVE